MSAIINAAHYGLLPDPALNSGVQALVAATTVIDEVEYYRGYYISDGSMWKPSSQQTDALRAEVAELKAAHEAAVGDIPETLDDLADGTTNKHLTATEKSKLAGIAPGATANATDAALVSRANHTGSQAINTVTGLQTALDGKQAAGSYAASSHSHVPNDVTGLPAKLTKLDGIKVKRAEAFTATTDANGDVTINTSAAFTNPRVIATPAGSGDGVGYSTKITNKSGTSITIRAYRTKSTVVVLLNTNVDPDEVLPSALLDILVVEPE